MALEKMLSSSLWMTSLEMQIQCALKKTRWIRGVCVTIFLNHLPVFYLIGERIVLCSEVL